MPSAQELNPQGPNSDDGAPAFMKIRGRVASSLELQMSNSRSSERSPEPWIVVAIFVAVILALMGLGLLLGH
jgi:hypothetical protein